MKYRFIFLLLGLTLITACKKDYHLNKIEGKRLNINDSIKTSESIEAYIKPYRENVNKNLDSVISYSLDTYSKRDGELNTAIGNLFADATFEEANPVFKKRTGDNIDLVLLNHGGIRSIISKGNVSARTAYEIMPFENSLVVATLNGEQIKELITYLQLAKRAHPIAGLNIVLNEDYSLNKATINGNVIDYSRSYNVLTNDYLFNRGDRMDFFQKRDTVHVLNYKVRNALLDYFKKKDTLNPAIDNRFIRLQ